MTRLSHNAGRGAGVSSLEVPIETLRDLLDASLATASPFTRSLEGEERTARQVEEFINATRNVTVAVVRRNGLPHAAPVIGGCVEGEIYVTVSPGSVLANCLVRSREVAFTAADLVHTLIGAGTAEKMGRASELSELCHRLDLASPFGTFAPEGWNGYVFMLSPHRLFAW
jgi:hypothetical protein